MAAWKTTWWWLCSQYITVSGKVVPFPGPVSWIVLDSLGKSGAADEYTAIVGLNLWSSACRSDCLQVHSFPGSKFYLFWKNATPERFEFRFNPLNRNVLVKPKPNLLLSCDNRRFWRARKKLQPYPELQARLAGKEELFRTTVIGENRTGQGYTGFFQTYPCIPGQVQFLEICRFEAVHGGNIFMYNYNPPIVVKSIRVATHFCRAIILYLS